jgi:hypothetical protein
VTGVKQLNVCGLSWFRHAQQASHLLGGVLLAQRALSQHEWAATSYMVLHDSCNTVCVVCRPLLPLSRLADRRLRVYVARRLVAFSTLHNDTALLTLALISIEYELTSQTNSPGGTSVVCLTKLAYKPRVRGCMHMLYGSWSMVLAAAVHLHGVLTSFPA